jgi:outer membrane protein
MNLGFRLLLASLTAAVALAYAPPSSAQTTMKVGVVDVQRAVSQTEDGLRAQATLKKLFDSRQQELNRKQQELAKQREEIEKQAKVISKEALQRRLDDWQKQMMELQATFVEYNKELEKKQKELTDPIVERVYGTVKRLANTDGFDIIVDKVAAPYVRSDLDLTDRVIQMANSGGAAPPPKPAPSGSAPAPKP